MKHQIKLLLRELYARLLAHTGLHLLVDRIMPRRLTILLGHCVDAPEVNEGLPADMKIAPELLERIVARLGRRYELATVSSAMESLASGGEGRSLVALTMDDGYRDNATHLLPLLRRHGAPATVYLESRPLDERRPNWSHLYFWLVRRSGADTFARRYLERSDDPAALEGLRRALEEGPERLEYRVKRVLKYEADGADRDRITGELFREAGGDEAALADELYLTWDQARELRDAGWELGGHTVSHPVLSRLSTDEVGAEIEGAAASLERELGGPGTSFAYPFGRPWDYDAGSVEAVLRSPYHWAVTTRAGTNDARTDPLELRRIAIGDETRMHLLVAEACGGFALLRQLGLDLSR